MRLIEFEIENLILPSYNVVLRWHHSQYTKFRNNLYAIVKSKIGIFDKPFEYAEIEVTLGMPAKNFLDVDNKYSAPKPLIDVLLPIRKHSKGGERLGINLIREDTDGEWGNRGRIKSYRVIQKESKVPYVKVKIKEVEK